VNDKPKRRWYQFSLKTLLIAFTILAIVSAVTEYSVHIWNDGEEGRRMQRMNELILSNGGYWGYDSEKAGNFLSLDHATATQLDTVLKELSTFDNQKSMGFDDSQFGDTHVKAIRGHHGLESIGLNRTLITDEGLKELTAIKSLKLLELEDAAITDAGLEHLTKLQHLESLILDGDAVTDKGLEQLAKMPSLNHVRLKGTKVTQEGIAKLKRALPALEVNKFYGSPHKYEHYPDLSNSQSPAPNSPKP
jgi:hypothetical protein